MVDELNRGPKSQRLIERHDHVLRFLQEELEEINRLSARALTELLSPLEDLSIDTLLRWVEENGEDIAAEAQVNLTPGHRGQVARFEKTGRDHGGHS